MPVVTRSDGVQFVIGAYREIIDTTKKSLFQHKVHFRAQQQGEQVYIHKKGQSSFEVVFAKDPGYLLAETVRAYYAAQKNVIYCEALDGRVQALVVVVRDGNIVLDTRVPVAEVSDELLPFLLGAKFTFYVHGEVMISPDEEEGHFQIPAGCIESYEVLSDSLFEVLDAQAEFALAPIGLALKQVKYTTSYRPLVLSVLFMGLLVAFGWWAVSPSLQQTAPAPVVHKPTDVFELYKGALRSPAPAKVLAEMATTIEDLYFAPGWELSFIRYRNGQYLARYKTDSGSMEVMNEWAKANGYGFVLTQTGVDVTVNSQLSNRMAPTHVYRLQQVEELIIDEMNLVTRGKHVQLGVVQTHGVLKSQKVSVQITGASPDILILIGQRLKHLPLRVVSVNLNLANGLLSGTVEFEVWGD